MAAPASNTDNTISFESIASGYQEVQDFICQFLTNETRENFKEDRWNYDKGSGGGITRVWEGTNGHSLEKGGVNFSSIDGPSLPPAAASAFKLPDNTPYRACGISLVIHPTNPHCPTIHMNTRYFEAGAGESKIWWFGGGIDLTPYYPVLQQVIDFHSELRTLCESHGHSYANLKQICDEYFFLAHRNERRGVGGIFYDHMGPTSGKTKKELFDFSFALGKLFPVLYGPSFKRGLSLAFSAKQREYQLLRRGRYVEFNLIYDRGTKFGLQSNGRTESILMSLPQTCIWKYDWKPDAGSEEEHVMQFYLQPQDWLSLNPPKRV